MMSALQNLTHGTRGLEFAYGIAWVALLAGLRSGHASAGKLLMSPLLAIPVTLMASLLVALMSSLWSPSTGSSFVVVQLAFNMLCFAGASYAAGRALARRESSSDSTHRRGAVVTGASVGPARHADGMTLAGIPVALADETKHFKLIGTTGTGKSTAIRELLSAALARGDRAIIADPDGGYLARFYDAARGDVILNPFDGEARKWDLLAEITNDYDVEQLARSLIPDSGDSDRTWVGYARTLFGAVVQQAIAVQARDDVEIYRLLTAASLEELRVLLAGTPAGPFLEPGNEKMFGSVRSIASSAVAALKYTTRQQAAPLSVRRWVRDGAARSAGGQGGVLFLPYKAGEIAALRSMISAWLRIGIFEAMDRDEADQRLWFVVDELDALGEIDGLKDALARLRKFGGRCILGFQSIAQVSGTYGRGIAETIVENCGNTLILRCSASERGGTSEFASKLIGQREVIHTTSATTNRSGEWRASTTRSQQLKIEPAKMASEIERLPDLEGFLKLASVPDWQEVTLTPAGDATPARARKPAVVAPPRAPQPEAPARQTKVRSRKTKAAARAAPDRATGETRAGTAE